MAYQTAAERAREAIYQGCYPTETISAFDAACDSLLHARTPNDFLKARELFALATENTTLANEARSCIVDCEIEAGIRGPRTIDDKF